MRHPQWTTRLPETLKNTINRPFVWGEHDCCLFASDCVIAVCNFDPCERIRGRYKTKTGAFRVLQKEFGTLDGAVSRFFDEIPTNEAGRGDIVMFEGDEGETLGVLWAGKLWAVSTDGVRAVSNKPKKAWRVQ